MGLQHTRREFLGSLAFGILPRRLPGLSRALVASTAFETQEETTTGDAPILVVVYLSGGNDGLNTVVPCTNDSYYRARPRLAIPRSRALPLNGEFGLHPNLRGLKSLFDEGSLAIVHGVGYEDQVRSHSRSGEIWDTASDADGKECTGWLGRYLDECSGCSPDAAIGLGTLAPGSFLARRAGRIVFRDVKPFRLFAGGFSSAGQNPSDELFRKLNAVVRVVGKDSSRLAAGPRGPDSTIAFLQQTAFDALVTSERLGAAESFRTSANYGSSRIGRDLELVARFIGGGTSTRVFHVTHKGYDTHADQLPVHARLLSEIDQAIAAFAADMKTQGNWKRVTLMTYSEFGRRLQENANGGTDHGAASTLFIVGGRVRSGQYGRTPSLAPEDLLLGDPRHTMDYRSVYASIIEKCLNAKSLPILGRRFPLLEFV